MGRASELLEKVRRIKAMQDRLELQEVLPVKRIVVTMMGPIIGRRNELFPTHHT